MKISKHIAIILILSVLLQTAVFAAPRIPVYKVGNVLYFLDKQSGTITGFAGEPKDLTIPLNLGGYAVVSIGAGAFSGSSTLESLCIPEGISTISANAFSSCPNLKSVEIASSVSYIGSRAFSDCGSIVSVNFKGQVANIEPDAFENSSWLEGSSSDFAILGKSTLLKYNGQSETVVVPDGVKNISAGAFAYNTTVKEIILPYGLEKIGDNAFVHCYSLEKITIPSTVSHIGAGAFDDTVWMNNYKDDFVSVNGILISYKGNNVNVTLPDSITAIGAGAFMANEKLKSVKIGQGVIYIDSLAFADCTSLIQINIPLGVEWIDEYAFAGCVNLTLYAQEGSYGESYARYMQMPCSGEVYVSYNGETVYFTDVVPIIYYDRTFLPLRTLMEMMGFTVSWDDETKTAICEKNGRLVTVDSLGKIAINGSVSPTVAPPINIKGRNLVSARVILEAVDANVLWNDKTRTVEITF